MDLRNKLLISRFNDGMERLERALGIATSPFYAEIEAMEKAGQQLQQQIASGQFSSDPEDGDPFDDITDRRDEAQDMIFELRRSFVTAIYHKWERLARRLTGRGTSADHAKLVEALKSANFGFDETALQRVYVVNNTIKHNKILWGDRLRLDWPAVFDPAFDPDAINPISGKPNSELDWADAIHLSAEQMEKVFAAVVITAPT